MIIVKRQTTLPKWPNHIFRPVFYQSIKFRLLSSQSIVVCCFCYCLHRRRCRLVHSAFYIDWIIKLTWQLAEFLKCYAVCVKCTRLKILLCVSLRVGVRVVCSSYQFFYIFPMSTCLYPNPYSRVYIPNGSTNIDTVFVLTFLWRVKRASPRKHTDERCKLL